MPPDAPVPILDRLPGYLLNDLSGEWKKEPEANGTGKKGRSGEILLFYFQANEQTGTLDPGWSEKLKAEPGADEKLEKLTGLVRAYCRIAREARYVREQKERAAGSNYMNKIWFLMTKIFDVSAEGLPVTHTKIPDAVEIARFDLGSQFAEVADVRAAIDRMEKLDWSFAGPEEREQMLYEILGTDQLVPETKEILLSNEPDAFNFLKFYLFEIRDELLLKTSASEMIQQDDRQPMTKYETEMYGLFVREYLNGQNNKEPKKQWNARIIDLCREQLAAKDLFGNDFDRALKYYYSCRNKADPGRRFLWEVFRTDEILRNIFVKPAGKILRRKPLKP